MTNTKHTESDHIPDVGKKVLNEALETAESVEELRAEIIRLKAALAESERRELSTPDESVREAMDESGFWKSCSGCHETNEGASTGWYSFHPFFNCEQGSGCGECGGLGVIWDDTDYEDMVNWMQEQEALKGGE
ncbi:hypothetical protein DES40_1739 [Litorimonas taeanensis]|uniref:Uncharacterized protein n=1 Tax=Litorimonas taeanensis TaxID=568099 RepID=A0A420WD98_9PROT|nr:hypothetical protein [Litorimonas taeanensis]RKQ68963.1 hypothetical protein DES40_1739 [Litorimonas taeanensis]